MNMPKTIIENGIRVYKNIICQCIDSNGNNCGRRIPWMKSHSSKGIPKTIHGHFSKEHRENITKSLLGVKHTKERIKNVSDAHLKYYKKNPEARDLLSKIKKQNFIDNPEKLSKWISDMHVAAGRKNFDTKPELKVQNYVKSIINEQVFPQVPIPISHDTVYIVDFLIPDLKTVIEVNGCHWHYCMRCEPLQQDIYKAMDKQHADIERKFNLEQMDLKVIVIWEHDINSGKYKKILKRALL